MPMPTPTHFCLFPNVPSLEKSKLKISRHLASLILVGIYGFKELDFKTLTKTILLNGEEATCA